MANPGGIIPILIALFTFAIVFLLFYKSWGLDENASWSYILLLLSGITTFIVFVYNFIMGRLVCSKETGTFYKETGISVIFPIVAILIASIDKCRIPIASILQSLYTDTNPPETITGGRRNKLKGGNCCEKQIALTDIESQHPGVKGTAYGFYIFFGILYAITYSNSVLSC